MSLPELPLELFIVVAGHCTIPMLATMEATARFWYFRLRDADEALWKPLALLAFSRLKTILILSPPPDPINYRMLYRKQLLGETASRQSIVWVFNKIRVGLRVNSDDWAILNASNEISRDEANARLTPFVFTTELLYNGEVKEEWSGRLMFHELEGDPCVSLFRPDSVKPLWFNPDEDVQAIFPQLWSSYPRWLTECHVDVNDIESDLTKEAIKKMRCRVFITKNGQSLLLSRAKVLSHYAEAYGITFAYQKIGYPSLMHRLTSLTINIWTFNGNGGIEFRFNICEDALGAAIRYIDVIQALERLF